jgi:hypothetical protein
MKKLVLCIVVALCNARRSAVGELSDAGSAERPDRQAELDPAAAPRTPDGTPDLSGLWQTRTIEIPGVEPLTEPVAGSLNFPPEFGNISAGMKDRSHMRGK